MRRIMINDDIKLIDFRSINSDTNQSILVACLKCNIKLIPIFKNIH